LSPAPLGSIRTRFALVLAILLLLGALNIGSLYWGARRSTHGYEALGLAIRRHSVLSETRLQLDDHYKRVQVVSTLVGGEQVGLAPAERDRVIRSLDTLAARLDTAPPGLWAAPGLGSIRDRSVRLARSWRTFYATQTSDPARALSELVLTAEPLAEPLLGRDLPAAIQAQDVAVESARAGFERADAAAHRVVWGILVLTAALSVGLSYTFTRDLLRAIRGLKTAAERFGAGDLEYRVQAPALEELEEVAAGLNTMAERLRGARNELQERNEELAQLAYCDTLTRLGNRALFRHSVEHALGVDGCRPESVAVLFLDLDNFKAANDSLGHAAGDRLLVEIAGRILGVCHGGAIVARLGGDEFAILLAPASPGEAVVAAENVIVAVEAPLELSGRLVHVGASIGVAFGREGGDADELLRDADVAMYRAKAAGKGCYQVFAPEMHAALLHRLELEEELRGVLDRGELVLHYQPVVELEGARVRGFEALVRWQHPRRGLIPPSVFIPLAEESGMILGLGRWVLMEACQEAMRWQELALPGARVNIGVNVSGSQLDSPRFLVDVRRALDSSGLNPHCLVLEITEGAIMRDSQATLRRLRELKELGVRLAVDDFGTGYSSLAYLQRFPVDVLKIDKAFIDSVARGGNDAALTRTIVSLAEMLDLGTVAEGIEEPEQLAQLRALGCEMGQGYLFARPLPRQEAFEFLSGALEAGSAPRMQPPKLRS
jgi:diguanylate cyclase (GGDEF)-like protein